MSEKQDRQGARTFADLERRYQFGKTFAEITGMAEDAQEEAGTAVQTAKELDEKLDQDEIFKRLTNSGKSQGVFKGEDGNIYVNASYIVAIAELFAKDIEMSGKFTNTAEVFLLPGEEELQTIRNHFDGTSIIPDEKLTLYDFNNDASVDRLDYLIAKRAMQGTYSLDTWSGAVKSIVTVTIDLTDVNKIIRIHGTNMWGREVDTFISANAIQSTFAPKNYVDNVFTVSGENLKRNVDGVTEWLNPPMNIGTEYRTVERWNGKAVYTKLINLGTSKSSETKTVTIDSGITNLIRASPNLNSALCNCINGEFSFYAERISDTAIDCCYTVSSNRVGQRLYVQIWYTVD